MGTMDAPTSPLRPSSLPFPPPRPPVPGTRTGASPRSGPSWVAVAATVVAQFVWLVAVFYAWIITIVVIGYSGGVFGTGPEHIETWIVLASVGALALAPVPTVAFVAYRRTR